MEQRINIFWFRRDLRLHDNHGLYEALKKGMPLLPVFVFDTSILEKLPSPADSRVSFIYQQVAEIKAELEKKGSSLKVIFGSPAEAFKQLLNSYNVGAVYANKDYEPYSLQRDGQVGELLVSAGTEFNLYKDHLIFEEDEILNNSGLPYTVFTPYSRKWKSRRTENDTTSYPSEQYQHLFVKTVAFTMPLLEEMGFKQVNLYVPPAEISDEIIVDYARTRDIPSVTGTSRLGVHLRFGTISIRELVRKAAALSEVFLNELIWREFFSSVLWHFPHVTSRSFRPEYERLQWRNNEQEFVRWCRGETGYPIVDAGMRELNETGFMHNRVRMITASFLTRHLLIDWRWGEAWFADKLLDYELASNNGNWQWAAGTGCDASPWFRIFNPSIQQKKFDPAGKYITRWVPEYGTVAYPQPIVEHQWARERALKAYKAVAG